MGPQYMKGSFKIVLSDNIIKYSIYSSLLLMVLHVFLVAFFIPKLPPLIPLLNSQPWGGERLYPAWTVIFLPPFLILVFVLNNMISTSLYKRNVLIARLLSFNSLLFILLSLLAFIQIIFLVF